MEQAELEHTGTHKLPGYPATLMRAWLAGSLLPAFLFTVLFTNSEKIRWASELSVRSSDHIEVFLGALGYALGCGVFISLALFIMLLRGWMSDWHGFTCGMFSGLLSPAAIYHLNGSFEPQMWPIYGILGFSGGFVAWLVIKKYQIALELSPPDLSHQKNVPSKVERIIRSSVKWDAIFAASCICTLTFIAIGLTVATAYCVTGTGYGFCYGNYMAALFFSVFFFAASYTASLFFAMPVLIILQRLGWVNRWTCMTIGCLIGILAYPMFWVLLKAAPDIITVPVSGIFSILTGIIGGETAWRVFQRNASPHETKHKNEA